MSFGLQSARNSKPNKSRDVLRIISCNSATSASILSMVSSSKKLSCTHPIMGRWLARMITSAAVQRRCPALEDLKMFALLPVFPSLLTTNRAYR